jgi:hypothetical protein
VSEEGTLRHLVTDSEETLQLINLVYSGSPDNAPHSMLARLHVLLREVRYKPDVTLPNGLPVYRLLLGEDSSSIGGRLYLQVECSRRDTFTGCLGVGRGGKAYLSPHMTNSELVQTAFSLFKAYEEHEAREGFTYRGRRIYGPHIDIDALTEISDRLDVRS